MPFDHKSFPAKVRQAVQTIESLADVEVVVAVASRSGSYADVDFIWAILAGLAGLLAMIYGSRTFRVDFVVPNIVVAGLLGWWLSRILPELRRLLTRASRRHQQSRHAAAQFFWEHHLSITRSRRVVLIYLSRFERRAEILVDVGIDAAVPRAVWNEARHRFARCRHDSDLEQALFAELASLTKILPGHLPPGSSAPKANELSDEPVMLA